MKMRNQYSRAVFWLIIAVIFCFPWINYYGSTNPLMMQFFNFSFITWVFIALYIFGLITKQISFPKSKLFKPVIVLLIVKLVSTVFSFMPMRSLFGANSFMADGLLFFIELCLWGYLILALKPQKSDLRLVLQLLFLQASLMSIQMIFEAIGMGAPIDSVRVNSTLLNADYAISYLCITIPIGMGLAYDSWRKNSQVLSAFLISGLIFSIMAFYFLMPAFLQIFHRSNNPDVQSRKISGFLTNDSNTERYTQWKYGWQIGLDHPIIGSGPGTTRSYFYEKVANNKDWSYSVAMDLPHNDLIQQFSQTGILGLLAYLYLWISFFKVVIKNRLQIIAEDRPLYFSCMVGVAGFLIFNQFLFTTLYVSIVVLLVCIMLLMLSDSISYKSTNKLNAGQIGFICAPLLFCSLPIAYYTFKYHQAEVAYNNSRVAEASGNFLLASEYIDQAIANYPYDENYFAIGAGYHAIYAQIKQNNQKEYNIAKKYANQSIEINDKMPKFYINQGIINFLSAEDGSVLQTEAEEQIMQAVQKQIYNSDYYEYAAQALTARTSQKTREEFFDKLMDLAPDNLKEGVLKLREKYVISSQ